MHQLAQYSSDDESPYRRHSYEKHSERAEGVLLKSTSARERKRKERRRNSEYWTDGSADEEDRSRSIDPSPEPSGSVLEGEGKSSKKRSRSERSNRDDQDRSNDKPLDAAVASKNALSFTQSQTSLVSYGAHDDEDDEFDRADKRAVATKRANQKAGDQSASTNREPKPPRGHEDTQSPDDINMNVIVDRNQEFPSERSRLEQVIAGNLTPKSVESSGGSPSTHDDAATEIRVPSPPAEKCSKSLEDKFRLFFARKAAGADLNAMIKNRRDFKNPSMYERLIEKFGVNEYGSNFPRSVFDPHGFTDDCFYDHISAQQKEMMEKYNVVVEKKMAGSNSTKNVDAKRKSRFEGTKK